jgi:hypothetical protein
MEDGGLIQRHEHMFARAADGMHAATARGGVAALPATPVP